MKESWIDKYLGNVMIISLVGVLIIGGIIGYKEATSDKFYLTKSDWVCENSEQEQTLVWAGKALVPIYTDVCQTWVKK